MDFKTFVQSGRHTKCLRSEEALGLFHLDRGVQGMVFPGNVFVEFIDGDIKNGIRAEIGSYCKEGTDLFSVLFWLYEFARDEELFEEKV